MKKKFWLYLAATNLLLILPGFIFFALTLDFSFHADFSSLQVRNPDLLKVLHLDFFLLLTILFILRNRVNPKVASAIIIMFILFVFAYELYHYFIFSIVNRHPIVLIDLFQLINLAHLSTELVSPVLLIIALPLSGWLLYKLVQKLVWPIVKYLNYPTIALSFKRFLWIFFSVYLVIVLLITSQRRRFLYKSTLNNVKISIRASLQQLKAAEEFPDLVEAHIHSLKNLHNEPLLPGEKINVYLFMIESYGKVFAQSPGNNISARKQLQHWQSRLSNAGWNSFSKHSVATVKGGNSWVSIGTVLTGIPLHNVIVYSQLLKKINEVPHLISTLNKNDYMTLSLQPGTRNRLGLKLLDHYKHGRFISYDDLDYRGPAYGLAGMPDQYALNYAHEKFIQHIEKPVFLFFETVSSHAPWRFRPTYLDNWRNIPEKLHGQAIDARAASSYFKLIEYDLEVIVSYIEKHIKNKAIILITGDHQPGFFHWSDDSYEVPLHILVKEKNKAAWLQKEGFKKGLSISDSVHTTRHEKIYPLIWNLLKN